MSTEDDANEAIRGVMDRLNRITDAGDAYDKQIEPQYRKLDDARTHRWRLDYDKAVRVAGEVGAEIEALERDLFGATR